MNSRDFVREVYGVTCTRNSHVRMRPTQMAVIPITVLRRLAVGVLTAVGVLVTMPVGVLVTMPVQTRELNCIGMLPS